MISRRALSSLVFFAASAAVFSGFPFAQLPWAHAQERPNILWLTSEDNGPELGCYGDSYANTPHIDALAERGVRFLHCWSNAPVCAPARTTLIAGVYPVSTGAQHMRSEAPFPPGLRTYPEALRAAGYYCVNPGKTDYNYAGLDKRIWDEPVPVARLAEMAAAGRPFMAVYNSTASHESQIRKRPHLAVHDPAGVRIPAYHPDTLESRQDWAQYYDKVSEMDVETGTRLREFEELGLLDSTIVFYFGDHGPGMPRSKRWPYNSGLRVPLIVFVPERFRDLAPDGYAPGGASRRLVGFVDFAPTVLSIAGVKPPDAMQGHAFMGAHPAPEQPYLYGFRGRMDERYDLVRTVRDERYQYIRNYNPHEIYGQFVSYMFETPTTRSWRELFDAGALDEAQSAFWRRKPAEELYDLHTDPDEVRNLAESPEHRAVVERLRAEERSWILRVRDLGFLPEGEIHARASGRTPWEMGQNDEDYPLKRIVTVAALAAAGSTDDDVAVLVLVEAMRDPDSAVRYWGAMGLLMREDRAVGMARESLLVALEDDSPYVRITAAEALARFGTAADLEICLDLLVTEADVVKTGLYRSMSALNAIDAIGNRAGSRLEAIRGLPRTGAGIPGKLDGYVGRLLDRILSGFSRFE